MRKPRHCSQPELALFEADQVPRGTIPQLAHSTPTGPASPSPASHDATAILHRINRDEGTAAAELLPLVYDELRRLAAAFMKNERADHTLQPTALVHEAYVRLIKPAGDEQMEWKNRSHFLGVAATAMRRVLVDHARAHNAQKRGGGGPASLALDDAVAPSGVTNCEVLALDEVLTKLARSDARTARVVELRFFGGLTIEQSAAVLGVSHFTVEGDWALARAWLARELSSSGS
jgi:RNA polymerase sigma-70 factor, ECF subfamily